MNISSASVLPNSREYTNGLRAGATLTVAAPSGGSALVRRHINGQPTDKTSVAGGSTTAYGPYQDDCRFSITAFGVTCSVSIDDNTGAAIGSVDGGGSPVTITGANTVGAALTAVPAAGWQFTTGQWYLDGATVGSSTAVLTITQLSAAIGKAYGFQPTGVPFRATAALTVAAPVGPSIVAALGNRGDWPATVTPNVADIRIGTVTGKVNNQADGTAVRGYFPFFFMLDGGKSSANLGTSQEVAFAIRVGNSYYRATFNGAQRKTNLPGEGAWCDPIMAPITKGTFVRHITAEKTVGATQRLTSMAAVNIYQEGGFNTADDTLIDSVLAGTYGRDCTASVVVTSGNLAMTITSPGTGWTAASAVIAIDPVTGGTATVGNTNAAHTSITPTAAATNGTWPAGTTVVVLDAIANSTAVYGPSMIVYTTAAGVESELNIGDSNGTGWNAGDSSGDADRNFGALRSSISNARGSLNNTVLGRTASAYADDATGATAFVDAAIAEVGFVPTYVNIALGTNDAAPPSSYSAGLITGKLNTIGAAWKAKGCKVGYATLPPRTNAGNTASVAGFGIGGTRDTLNASIRAGTVLSGSFRYFDGALAVFNAVNTDLWPGTAWTPEGIHYSRSTSIPAIVASSPFKNF